MIRTEIGAQPLTLTKAQVEDALRLSGGNRSQAAKQLGISSKSIYRLVERYQIPVEDQRGTEENVRRRTEASLLERERLSPEEREARNEAIAESNRITYQQTLPSEQRARQFKISRSIQDRWDAQSSLEQEGFRTKMKEVARQRESHPLTRQKQSEAQQRIWSERHQLLATASDPQTPSSVLVELLRETGYPEGRRALFRAIAQNPNMPPHELLAMATRFVAEFPNLTYDIAHNPIWPCLLREDPYFFDQYTTKVVDPKRRLDEGLWNLLNTRWFPMACWGASCDRTKLSLRPAQHPERPHTIYIVRTPNGMYTIGSCSGGNHGHNQYSEVLQNRDDLISRFHASHTPELSRVLDEQEKRHQKAMEAEAGQWKQDEIGTKTSRSHCVGSQEKAYHPAYPTIEIDFAQDAAFLGITESLLRRWYEEAKDPETPSDRLHEIVSELRSYQNNHPYSKELVLSLVAQNPNSLLLTLKLLYPKFPVQVRTNPVLALYDLEDPMKPTAKLFHAGLYDLYQLGYESFLSDGRHPSSMKIVESVYSLIQRGFTSDDWNQFSEMMSKGQVSKYTKGICTELLVTYWNYVSSWGVGSSLETLGWNTRGRATVFVYQSALPALVFQGEPLTAKHAFSSGAGVSKPYGPTNSPAGNFPLVMDIQAGPSFIKTICAAIERSRRRKMVPMQIEVSFQEIQPCVSLGNVIAPLREYGYDYYSQGTLRAPLPQGQLCITPELHVLALQVPKNSKAK